MFSIFFGQGQVQGFLLFRFDASGFKKSQNTQVDIRISGKSQIFCHTTYHEFNDDELEFCKKVDQSRVLSEIGVDGLLHLKIEIKLKYPSEKVDIKKEIAERNKRILENKSFSDFKFIVRSKEFHVHRNILSAASPVFAKLFTTGMEEARKKECIIGTIEPEIFSNLMQFIYCGKLPDELGKVAMKLYSAAHYYEIETLKEFCVHELPSTLKKDNAMEIFNWACIYDLEDLKKLSWAIIKWYVICVEYLMFENSYIF